MTVLNPESKKKKATEKERKKKEGVPPPPLTVASVTLYQCFSNGGAHPPGGAR